MFTVSPLRLAGYEFDTLGTRDAAAWGELTLEKLARYTGLSKEYLENTDLRVEIMRFCKELLRSEKKTVGRLDVGQRHLDVLDARAAHGGAFDRPL